MTRLLTRVKETIQIHMANRIFMVMLSFSLFFMKRLPLLFPVIVCECVSHSPPAAAERREARFGKGTQAESGIHIYNYIIYLKEKAYSCVFFEKIITFENSISAFCPENVIF